MSYLSAEIDPPRHRDFTAFVISIFLNASVLFFVAHPLSISEDSKKEIISVPITRVAVTEKPEAIQDNVKNDQPVAPQPQPITPKPPAPTARKISNLIDRKSLEKKSVTQNSEPIASNEATGLPRPPSSNEQFTTPSVEAQPTNQIDPEIPFELRSQDFKSYVRVKVVVNIDGSSEPSLKTSSGNLQIDAAVEKALMKWKWQPAAFDGTPVRSVRYFKFEFEVK